MPASLQGFASYFHVMMGTVFLTNLAVVAGKYKGYDVLSTILDFKIPNRLPLKKLQLLKTLKRTLFICVLSFFPKLIHRHNYLHVSKEIPKHC